MMKSKSLYKNLRILLDEGVLALVRDDRENLYAKIYIQDELVGMELVGGKQFVPLFKELYFEKFKDFLGNQEMQLILEMLAMEGRRVTEKVKLSKRIYRTEDVYLYELDAENNTVVWIENGKIRIEDSDEIYFKHSPNDAPQVTPDLDEIHNLGKLLERHFEFQTQDDLNLFKLYLVSCFLGLEDIQHPILILKGEKGASKSTTMRMLSKIVSPQVTDLGGQFNNLDDLQLSMANNYMVMLDNMREIPKKVSDVLCRVVTGGSYQKRKLYTDNEMLSLDLNCLVVISSIAMPIKEPDLIDRAIVLELKRIDPKKRKSESLIWRNFNKDLPKILGAIFRIIARVLQDHAPFIETSEYIRLVDFHQACLRIGRACGMKEGKVNYLLNKHKKDVNQSLLCEDVAIGCFIEFMLERKAFRGSVSGLLNELYVVAEDLEVSLADMPKQANQLSRKLNRVKSNLEETYKICFEIHNTGVFREIHAEVK